MPRPHPNAPASLPSTMRAMQLERPGEALRAVRLAVPRPARGQEQGLVEGQVPAVGEGLASDPQVALGLGPDGSQGRAERTVARRCGGAGS